MEIILEDYHDLPLGEYEIKEAGLYVKLVASDKTYYVNLPTVARMSIDFFRTLNYIYDGSIILE